jgi:hypothetical protein
MVSEIAKAIDISNEHVYHIVTEVYEKDMKKLSAK